MSASELLNSILKLLVNLERLNLGAGVWVGEQVDPLAVFVGVARELGRG